MRVAVVLGLAVALSLGPGAAAALGHSQLVSSSPGAGQIIATAPAQLRLVFSEPIEGRYTSLDLLDATGRAILVGVGHLDPGAANALVEDVSQRLPDGAYAISWRAVSASDGHATSGFFSFGVGSATLPAGATSTSVNAATLHAGHSGATASLEVFAKTLAYGGALLAFGLWIVGLLVMRPVRGRVPGGLVLGQAGALVLAAAGAALLAWVNLTSLPPGGQDLGAFATATRIGQLLGGRVFVAVAGAAACLALAGRFGSRRPGVAATVAGLGGGVCLLLTAMMGHSAAFDPPVPLVLDAVHLGVAGIWFSGLLSIALLTGFGSGPMRAEIRELVPRFSALALVAGALLAATGLTAAWTMTGDFTSLASDYSVNLALKVALVLGAFGLGAVNLFDGGRDRYPLGFSRRIAVEAGLAFAIVVTTANLTSGSPPGEVRPLAIAPSTTTAARTIDAHLSLQPAVPGPNQAWVGLPTTPPPGGTVNLVLQRLDVDQGGSTVTLNANPPVSGVSGHAVYTASGLLLPRDSRWDATVALSDVTGAELGRQRFVFALDERGLSAGREVPPLDPPLIIGILLLVAAVVGIGFWLGGGRPPLVEPRLGRQSLAIGSALGAVVGALVLLGPR